jgi:hypothetical protein
VILKGPHTARIFRRGEEPFEAASGSNVATLVQPSPFLTGVRV